MHRLAFFLLLSPLSALAAGDIPTVGGIPVEFILFALTLLGVALFHHATLYVALGGLTAISAYKIAVTGFKTGVGVAGFVGHLGHEWVTVANLFCLLTGFALLARMVSPAAKLPSRMALASGFSICAWIARFKGRAPNTGSKPAVAAWCRWSAISCRAT